MQRTSVIILKIDSHSKVENVNVELQRMPQEIQIHTEHLAFECIKMILLYLSKNRQVKLSFEKTDAQLSFDFQLKLDIFKNCLLLLEDNNVFLYEYLFEEDRVIKNLNILSENIKNSLAFFKEAETQEPQPKRRRIDYSASDSEAMQAIVFSVILINLLDSENLDGDLIKTLLDFFSERQIKSLQQWIASLNLNTLQSLPEQLNLAASSASNSTSATISATSQIIPIHSALTHGCDLENASLIAESSSSQAIYTGSKESTVSSPVLIPKSMMPLKMQTSELDENSKEKRKEAEKTAQIGKVYNNPFVLSDQKKEASQARVLQGEILAKIQSCQLESDWRTVRFFLKKNSGTTYEKIDEFLKLKYQNGTKLPEVIESHRCSPAGLKIVFKNKINTPEEIWENLRIIFNAPSVNKHQISDSSYHLSTMPLTHVSQVSALPRQQSMPIIPHYPVSGLGQTFSFFANGQRGMQTGMKSAFISLNQGSEATNLKQDSRISLNTADSQAQAPFHDFDNKIKEAVSKPWDPDIFLSTTNEVKEAEKVSGSNFVNHSFSPY